MKNILDKINRADEIQANLELDKTELGTHEVELGSIDELKSDAIAYAKAFENYNSEFEGLKGQIKALSIKYAKLSDVYRTWLSFYSEVNKKAKDLGVNLPNDVIKLEKDAIDKSAKAANLGNEMYRFLNK